MRAPAAHAGDRRHGPGRVILALYLVFVIGTVSRSAAQILTRFDEAPLAYSLSAVAAAVFPLAWRLVGRLDSRRR